ncbi:putative translocon subunit [Calocera viscosa TUFC12733]|uniref:Putative translocon subunit n=1 Tax=Calocera viscosa (strain TUFC12733) TaxID=1330018 RepID=A0A167GQM0_CALVF|nr:putative translocon subunit [Calocera viscosa TUFC12733]
MSDSSRPTSPVGTPIGNGPAPRTQGPAGTVRCAFPLPPTSHTLTSCTCSRRAASSKDVAARPNSTRAAGAGGSSSTMMRLYTNDDSAGLKVDPYVVLVLSICFIGSVFFLHIAAKVIKAFTK